MNLPVKRRTSLIAGTVPVLIGALVLSFVLHAQNNRQLYLVTGYTTRNGPQKVASNLFRVDPIGHSVDLVSELIAAKVGSLSTNVDHERRVVALVSGSNEAVAFSMDDPGVTRRFPIPHEGFQTLASFVDVPRSLRRSFGPKIPDRYGPGRYGGSAGRRRYDLLPN